MTGIVRRVAARYMGKTAILKQKKREETGEVEWALFDSKGKRVLKWFGAKKPSDEAVLKEERRIQFFKHQGSHWRSAGLFAAPPAMLATIGDWIRSVYASYTLSRVEEKIAGFREKAKLAEVIQKIDDLLEDLPAVLDKAQRRKRALRFDLSTAHFSDYELKIKWVPEYEIPLVGGSVQTGGKRWEVDLPLGLWNRSNADPTEAIQDSLGRYRGKLEKALGELPETIKPLQRGLFVELARLEKKLRPLVRGKPKQRVTDLSRAFPVDLRGWAYAKEVTPEMMAVLSKWWSDVTVRLAFRPKGWGGLWEVSKKRLSITMPRSRLRLSVDGFDTAIAGLWEVLDHELQHLGQDLLRALKDLGEEGGLPSGAIRDPSLSPTGRPRDPEERRRIKQRDKRVDHALRDVEFYPNLTTTIHSFKSLLKKYPKSQYRAIAREYVGADPPKILRGPGGRFKTLRDRAPRAKWEKAVKEFLKAIEPMI